MTLHDLPDDLALAPAGCQRSMYHYFVELLRRYPVLWLTWIRYHRALRN